MKLICDIYNYADAVEYIDINYFSPVREDTRERIDLYDYLIVNGISNISLAKSQRSETDSKFYIEAGNVSLKLSNTLIGYSDVNNYANLTEVLLTEFFQYNTNSKRLFKLTVYDDNDNSLFTGFFRKQNIGFEDRSSEIMTIDVVGIEKEFVSYFSNQKLIDYSQVVPNTYFNFNFQGLQFATLMNVLINNMPTVNFEFVNNTLHFLKNYIVAIRPYIYSPVNNLESFSSTLVLKSGYEQFQLDGTDIYSYFNSLITPMGWKWFFKGEQLYIEKRSDRDKAVTVIDYNDVISHSFIKNVEVPIENVIINNGEWYGHDPENFVVSQAMNLIDSQGLYQYLGGESAVRYIEGNVGIFGSRANVTRPFGGLTLTGNILNYHYERNFDNYSFSIVHDDTEDYERFRFYFGVQPGWTYQYQIESYNKSNTVVIDPVIPSSHTTAVLNLESARSTATSGGYYGNGNAYVGVTAVYNSNVSSMYYRGNPASSMLRYDIGRDVYIQYDDHVRSEEFRDSLKTYTNDEDVIRIELQVNGLLTDYDTDYKIENYPYENYADKRFTYENLEYDINTNTTLINLVSV